jgi:Domain of unknown function (DUF543)
MEPSRQEQMHNQFESLKLDIWRYGVIGAAAGVGLTVLSFRAKNFVRFTAAGFGIGSGYAVQEA